MKSIKSEIIFKTEGEGTQYAVTDSTKWNMGYTVEKEIYPEKYITVSFCDKEKDAIKMAKGLHAAAAKEES